MDADGQPQHPGDMAAQLELALNNLEAVLAAGDMTLANIVRLNAYTTDVDELFKHWAGLKDRFRELRCSLCDAAGSTTAPRVAGGNRDRLTGG